MVERNLQTRLQRTRRRSPLAQPDDVGRHRPGRCVFLCLAWVSYCLVLNRDPGFDYQFNALNPDEKPNELSDAFATVFSTGERVAFLPILQAWFPIFRAIVCIYPINFVGDVFSSLSLSPANVRRSSSLPNRPCLGSVASCSAIVKQL